MTASWSWIRRRVRSLFNRSAVEREMHDELALHFDLHVKTLEGRGLSPLAARRQASIDFAGMEQVKESYREARGVQPIESLMQDVRYALRSLIQQRVFTAAVVLTFAIGIGATTAIYSLVDAAWFRWSRSFGDADRLVFVYKVFIHGGWGPTTPHDSRDWRAQTRTLSATGAYTRGAATIAAGGEPVRASSASVTAGFFDVLRVRPAAGRFFQPDEEQWGNHGRLVLSYATWQRDFAGDPAVVGRRITLNGAPAEIIGVAPRGAWFGANGPEVYLPLAFAPNDPTNSRNSHFVFVIGRLGDKQSVESATADMNRIMKGITERFPDSDGEGARVSPMKEVVLGDVTTTLSMLLGAAVLLLVIACANVTNLLLVRTTARGRELAVRAALGASRARLTQQLWTESVILAVVGGALGVIVAASIVGWLGSSLPLQLPRIADTGVQVDLRVLGLTLAIVLGVGILCGTLPAMDLLRGDRSEALRAGSRSIAGGRRGTMIRGGLVAAQVSIGVMLLVVTGLLTRSLQRLQQEDHGANANNVLSLRLALPANARTDSLGTIRYYDDLLRRVRDIRGVEMAGVASHLPLSGGGETKSFWVEGRQPTTLDEVPRVVGRMESAEALRTMGVTLVSGRWFAETDREGAPYVAIIGESVARKHFANESPIGKRISLFPPEALSQNSRQRPRFTVIGVIKDVQYLDAAATKEDAVYVHYPQGRRIWTWGPDYLVVKTAQPLAAIAEPIRAAVRAVDPMLPVAVVMPLEDRIAQSMRAPKFTAGLIATFAVVAGLLGIVGLYGVIAYSVARETRSIGVRLALGATPATVTRMVVKRGAVLAATGVLFGVGGAVAATKLIASQLFGVSPTDPMTYLAAAMTFLVLAVAVSWIPARRAAGTDAMIALRSD